MSDDNIENTKKVCLGNFCFTRLEWDEEMDALRCPVCGWIEGQSFRSCHPYDST